MNSKQRINYFLRIYFVISFILLWLLITDQLYLVQNGFNVVTISPQLIQYQTRLDEYQRTESQTDCNNSNLKGMQSYNLVVML